MYYLTFFFLGGGSASVVFKKYLRVGSFKRWGKDHCAVGLQFNKTGTDHKRT